MKTPPVLLTPFFHYFSYHSTPQFTVGLKKMTWLFVETLIEYHTHKQIHTQHILLDSHNIYIYIYILTPPVMCSKQLPVLH